MDWPELVRAAANCQACGLCAGRKNSTLFAPESTKITEAAASAWQADWFILGDPPDAEEDRLGQPFVAEDGRLLDNMLKAVGVSRHGSGTQGAYLSNIVKCRPLHGRAPQSSELEQCMMYLQREMELLRPKVILVMGRRAAQTLLGASSAQAALPLDKQRGTIHHYRDIPLVITYPLQTLRRTGALKAGAWADVCLAADVIAGKVP
jgi:uracil-DNA glycosylase family 4